jgi:transposase
VGDGQHLGFGFRITEAGLNSLAGRTEHEPEHRTEVESRPGTTFTPKEVAARYGVDIDKVYGWLRTGLLPSINVAAKPGGRKPRYTIRQQNLDHFEQARATKAPPPGRSRKRKNPGVEEFF